MPPDHPPIKTLFILPTFAAGGAERVMITLMNGLNRSHFIPSIVAVLKGGSLESLIDPHITRRIIGAGGFFKSLPSIYSLLKNERPDIVISSMAPMNFTLLLLRPFFPRTKFIVREATMPSYIINLYPHLRRVMRCAYKYLYAKADIVIVPAHAVLNEFTQMGIGKLYLLYNPVLREAIDISPAKTKKALGLQSHQTLFIASGRLNRQKGFDRLMEILPLVKSDWHLIILGEGEERETLEQLISQKNLGSQVTLAGHQDEPWNYYKAADCLLLPSRVEGLPNVALESLSCGTPVIAIKDAGGVCDIAALSNDVLITDTMQDFTKAMERVKPKTLSRNLLPEIFEESRIAAEFTNLLKGVATNPH